MNGDGVNDLVVGSYYYGEIQSGAVSIYFGGSVLSNEPDVVLYGSNYVDDSWGLNFGYRVVSGCDVNGDGFDDLLVYGKGIESVFSGNVFVFLGGSEFSTSCALHLVGTEVREELGNKLTAGDINGDGYDDIILTRTTNYNSTNVECFLDIYAGGPTLNNVPVFETVVQTYQHGAASKYLADGDINGDGYEDILGIYYADSASTIGIIYGASTFSTLSTTVFPFLNYYDGSPMSYCDFDGDQFSDLFFERYRLSPTGPGNGYFTVFEQNNPVLNLDCDYIFSGDQDMTNYGKGYFLGDMNQDGFPEFFVYSDDLSPNEIVNYGTILSQNYVSINDPVITNLKSGILCYPNPFSHYFKIQLSGKQTNTIHEVRIYNIRGRLVYSGKNIKSSSFTLNFYNSSLANISNGIYIVKVFGNNDSIYTSKILYLKGDNR
ncbi:MAG TPA: FG-GAP-like repeat-containing protein [Candidatus Cloacimonadota bacterium]|nr:FG-GAP-like repeat-containing protein [Candidatus Cloacimonadota bacterium]HPT72155.1 FG-GAP-like repeat-containing protein [Candidatus Cloacimonadota bacterium]